jgi:hypothetical protein
MGAPMPYPKADPIDVKAMELTRYDGHHTICQNLRDMYHMAEKINTDPAKKDELIAEIRLRCRIGMTMAKKMNKKLKWYKKWYVTTMQEDPKPIERKIDKEKIEV